MTSFAAAPGTDARSESIHSRRSSIRFRVVQVRRVVVA